MWSYVKPLACETVVSDFERDNDVEFPEDLKSCLVQNNGGRPSRNLFDIERRSKENVFKALLSFNKSDVETIYMAFPVPKEGQKLIPFASTPSGDLICMRDNAIVLYSHETGGVEKIADSFKELLSKLYSG